MKNLSELNTQIQKLIHLHQQCLEANNLLRVENKALLVEIENQKKKISALEEKNKAVVLAKALEGNTPGTNKELKETIGRYITEIDKIITTLNSQTL